MVANLLICMLYSHDQLYKQIYMHAEHNDTIKTSDSSLDKYTSHFIERVVRERELETEQNGNILTPRSIGHNRVSFSFSSATQPGAWGPSLSGTCSHSSIFSPTCLIPNSSDLQLLNRGSQGPLLLGAVFSTASFSNC